MRKIFLSLALISFHSMENIQSMQNESNENRLNMFAGPNNELTSLLFGNLSKYEQFDPSLIQRSIDLVFNTLLNYGEIDSAETIMVSGQQALEKYKNLNIHNFQNLYDMFENLELQNLGFDFCVKIRNTFDIMRLAIVFSGSIYDKNGQEIQNANQILNNSKIDPQVLQNFVNKTFKEEGEAKLFIYNTGANTEEFIDEDVSQIGNNQEKKYAINIDCNTQNIFDIKVSICSKEQLQMILNNLKEDQHKQKIEKYEQQLKEVMERSLIEQRLEIPKQDYFSKLNKGITINEMAESENQNANFNKNVNIKQQSAQAQQVSFPSWWPKEVTVAIIKQDQDNAEKIVNEIINSQGINVNEIAILQFIRKAVNNEISETEINETK